MKKTTDEEILLALREAPQQGMELLLETYTGLIWKIISFHLSNPEDIRECTNDTFAEFYFCRDSFDAEKSSLGVFLAAIARHLAISRFRKEKKYASDAPLEELAHPYQAFDLIEAQADLEQALCALRPEELQIIRMKYYDGMTISEIAQSLQIPYETVKKRHQRSLLKLRHLLLLVLLFTLLLSCTAYTYKVLRRHNIIPPIYPLEQILFQEEDTEEDAEEPDSSLSFPDLQETADTGSEENEAQHSELNPEANYAPGESDQNPDDTTPVSQDETDQKKDLIPNPSGNDPASDDPYKESYKQYQYIPDYGIKKETDTPEPSYTLHTTVCSEDNQTSISIESASLINRTLRITLTSFSKTKPFSMDPEELKKLNQPDALRYIDGAQDKLRYHDRELACTSSTINNTQTPYISKHIWEYPNFTPDGEDEKEIPFTVQTFGLTLSFSLTPTTETALTENSLYKMKKYGGLLIFPRLENGSLKIAIHPLNTDEYQTLPGLVRGPYGEKYDGSTLTATDSAGTELTGSCIRYYPGCSTYFEWDFGPASPGTYSLHIPFLCQVPTEAESLSVPVNLSERSWEDTTFSLPGGTFRLSDCSESFSLPASDTICQDLTLSYENEDDTHEIIMIYGAVTCETSGSANTTISSFLSSDISQHTVTYRTSVSGDSVDLTSAIFTTTGRLPTFFTHTPVCYRWNESFDFTFTVE